MTQEEKDKRFLRNCLIASAIILLLGFVNVVSLRIYNTWDLERYERLRAEENALEERQKPLKMQETEVQKVAAMWTDAGIAFDENGDQKEADTTVQQVLSEDDDAANAVNAAADVVEVEPAAASEPQQAEISEPTIEELFVPANETVYATSTVNIRAHYSTDGEKLGSLSYGQSITRTGIGQGAAANWSRVEYNGTVAYINSKYISTSEPAKVEKTVKVETKADTSKKPKTGDRKTVDGVEYGYLEGFGWVEYSPGGTGIEVPMDGTGGKLIGY